tara:strand:+ start:3596 stop:3997 length:402 start_codon:yes stop_codon:yes gene_type:complete
MDSFVYFNLHKKCFSIRHNGFVVAHATTVVVDEATTKVSETGRQRVLKERVKNVHAGVVGSVMKFDGVATERGKALGWHDGCFPVSSKLINKARMRRVSYNPYKGNSFFYVDTDESFVQAGQLIMNDRKIYQL